MSKSMKLQDLAPAQAPVAEAVSPGPEFPDRLSEIIKKAEAARRRLMLDELAEAFIDLVKYIAETRV